MATNEPGDGVADVVGANAMVRGESWNLQHHCALEIDDRRADPLLAHDKYAERPAVCADAQRRRGFAAGAVGQAGMFDEFTLDEFGNYRRDGRARQTG